MKKLLQIGTLSLALIASLFILTSNTTQAASNGNAYMSLQITGSSGTCIRGTTSNLGSTGFSYDIQSISGAFTGAYTGTNFGTGGTSGSTWFCYDSAGVSVWTAKILLLSDLVNLSNGYTIPVTAVSYSNQPVHQQAGSGICDSIGGASTGITSWQAINSQQNLFYKQGTGGQVCRVQTTGLYLKVDIPASQSIGTYSGTIELTTPTF